MPDWNNYVPLVQSAAGAQTEEELERGLKGCFLEFGSKEITVTPDETKVGRGLFPLTEAQFCLPLTTDPERLGQIVREGLSRAR